MSAAASVFHGVFYNIFLAALALYFLVPGNLLILLGWAYIGGGSEYQKIHLGSYAMTVSVGLLLLLVPQFRRSAFRVAMVPSFATFACTTMAVALYAIAVKGVSIAPFVDTFYAALLAALTVTCLPDSVLARLRVFIDVYFVVNIPIAAYEYVARHGIITSSWYDTFRSSAFFDGPLVAAAMLGLYAIVLLIARPMSLSFSCSFRVLLAFTSLAAVLMTGGRTALVAATFLIGLFALWSFAGQAVRGYFSKAGLIYAIAAVPLLLGGVAAMFALGFFDTIAMRFADDSGSANTREFALSLVSHMSSSEFLFGMSPGGLINLLAKQQELGLVAIEISWVNFILVTGVIFTAALFLSYVGMFFFYFPRYCGARAILPGIFIILITASNNGIWAKTTVLILGFTIILSHMKLPDLSSMD